MADCPQYYVASQCLTDDAAERFKDCQFGQEIYMRRYDDTTETGYFVCLHDATVMYTSVPVSEKDFLPFFIAGGVKGIYWERAFLSLKQLIADQLEELKVGAKDARRRLQETTEAINKFEKQIKMLEAAAPKEDK